MTGFGRAHFEAQGAAFSVEVRSVNHRHLDLSLRLPRALQALEREIREPLRAAFRRGKVELSVTQSAPEQVLRSVEIDRELAGQYAAFAREFDGTYIGDATPFRAAEVLALPGVARVVEQSVAPEALAAPLFEAVAQAIRQLLAAREAEGKALAAALRAQLAQLGATADAIEALASEVAAETRDRLRKRSEELGRETGLLDQARLHQELVIAADRLDITEEVVRLRSHFEQFHAALDGAMAGDTVGRRLEFLIQELAREANTIGSKSKGATLSHRVVDLKLEIERLREQVLNLE